jgi:tetratricopeptide (TPR) repeat protein
LKKNFKKQMKQDELVTGFERLRLLSVTHADEVKIGAVVVLVLAVGGFALQHFRSQRERDSNAALSVALQTFRAPVAGENSAEPPEAGAPSFPNAADKYRKALVDLQGVQQRYASTPAATRARYYVALSMIELEQNEDAEKILKEIATQREGLEPSLAKLALADLQRRMGQTDRAADSYKQIGEDNAFVLPRDHALLSLAKLYEEARRPSDAQATYRQLIDKYPASAYVSEARRRVEYLQARG